MSLIQKQRIFFLGAGSMAEAMIKGLLEAGLVSAERMTISNRQRPARLQDLQNVYGVGVSHDKLADAAQADILLVAVKPFDLVTALREIAPAITSRHLIISVAAGVATEMIEQCIEVYAPVIRAMPNTSSFVQASATALCRGRWVTDEQVQTAQHLFSAIGTSVEVEEALMNAVTGLSGTGPAYFYYLVEALLEGGLECGLPAETCNELLIQTMYGAAKMLQETRKEPAELRRQVTSPNGTTMAAMQVLEQGEAHRLFIKAVQRATERAFEMGQQIATTNQ
jgi:pyrroline-5-carboxylate reductase